MVIFIVENDTIMAKCIELAIERQLRDLDPEIYLFSDAIMAVQALDRALPSLILLDVLPNGPNCFTFLNELSTYNDTAQIPIILLSTSDFNHHPLKQYNIFCVLDKDTMRPEDISNAVRGACAYAT